MKILVLQLARLGDIYQSWPALRALRRNYPDAQIDVMVRPRFNEALDGLDAVSTRIMLPTQELLAPLMSSPQDINQSVGHLQEFISVIKKRQYDWIINLSFSPLSSYLVHALQTPMTRVTGYTRHADGYFNMLGEISAYFYAQVGIGKYNRFHLTDLLGAMVESDLIEEDWHDPMIINDNLKLPEKYVVFHVGASETHKSLPAFKWARVVKYFSDFCPELGIVLIGSAAESAVAEAVLGTSKAHIVNLVGKTKVSDLFPILRKAQLFIGCDSAPIHISSLTKTPCLNISLGRVNFWETGPRAPRSYIFRAESPEEVVSEYVAMMMKEIIEGHEPRGLIKYVGGSPCYLEEESQQQRFAWDLVKAVYMGEAFPVTEDLKFFEGCSKLNAINEVILEQLSKLSKENLGKLQPILDRSDEVIHAIGQIIPELQVYTQWLKAERARVEPGSIEYICEETLRMHQALKALIRPYCMDEEHSQEGDAGGKI